MSISRSTTINIDGELYRTLLESAANKSLKEISIENGFSDSFLRMVVKTGKASPSAQAVARLYGIEPSAYKKKEDIHITCEPKGQISIDDIETIKRDELKELIKEVFNDIIYNCEIVIKYDHENGNRLYLQERGAYDCVRPKPELTKEPDRFEI